MIAHSMPGGFLYHYTSIDKALLIVQSGRLWLNKMNGVNDPKEFSDWNLSYKPNGRSITCAEWDTLNLEISNECKSMTKLACFTQDSITEYQDGFDIPGLGVLVEGLQTPLCGIFMGIRTRAAA